MVLSFVRIFIFLVYFIQMALFIIIFFILLFVFSLQNLIFCKNTLPYQKRGKDYTSYEKSSHETMKTG